MSVRYLALDDYLAIAVEVTGQRVATIVGAADLALADSALHAPMAGFSGRELYPDFVDKGAVLIVRLAKNHPLPDGNKRAAWASLRVFVALNGWTIEPYPSVDEAEAAVLAIAAGDWDEQATASWLRPILRPPHPLHGSPDDPAARWRSVPPRPLYDARPSRTQRRLGLHSCRCSSTKVCSVAAARRGTGVRARGAAPAPDGPTRHGQRRLAGGAAS